MFSIAKNYLCKFILGNKSVETDGCTSTFIGSEEILALKFRSNLIRQILICFRGSFLHIFFTFWELESPDSDSTI